MIWRLVRVLHQSWQTGAASQANTQKQPSYSEVLLPSAATNAVAWNRAKILNLDWASGGFWTLGYEELRTHKLYRCTVSEIRGMSLKWISLPKKLIQTFCDVWSSFHQHFNSNGGHFGQSSPENWSTVHRNEAPAEVWFDTNAIGYQGAKMFALSSPLGPMWGIAWRELHKQKAGRCT